MDMMHIWYVLCCFGLNVIFPMLIQVDNTGKVDFCNNWAVAGWIRHVKVKPYLFCKLKEAGILKVNWKSGDLMTNDLFTTSLGGPCLRNMVVNSTEGQIP